MEPMSNNGTLRLPLSPVGLHDPESTLEEPADPVETTAIGDDGKPPPDAEETASGEEDLATGLMSILPVETNAGQGKNPTPVGVDPVEVEPETQPASEDIDEGGGSQDNDDDGGSWFGDVWEWIQDKFDAVKDKVTGSWQ